MRVVDLTYLMHGEMPVFPGTEQPRFQQANTLEKDGFAETILWMYSHTGTHLDAPAHMKAGANQLDQLEAAQFFGKALLVDCRNVAEGTITKAHLSSYENRLLAVEFVLLQTGWSQYWGQPQYFKGFPALSLEAAQYLVQFPLKGIGIEAISIDPMETVDFGVHHLLFENNLVVIENLTNLESIQAESFYFSCLPLKYAQADGSPVRAVALVP